MQLVNGLFNNRLFPERHFNNRLFPHSGATVPISVIITGKSYIVDEVLGNSYIVDEITGKSYIVDEILGDSYIDG